MQYLFVEPAVRQRYIAFLSLFTCFPALAVTFQTRLENVEWTAAGDQFECRLAQPIADFGSGEFVRKAGEQPTFRLKAFGNPFGPGSATLLAAAAPWQPGRGDVNLGAVRVIDGEVPFNSSEAQAGRLLAGLLDGRSPVVRHHGREGGEPLEIRMLPVKFKKAYSDFQACSAKLLPMNFDQIKQAEIGFPGGGVDLDAQAKAKLDVMVAYIKADPTVNHVELDGHSDNAGNRLTNRELSRRRALAVMDYFKANGMAENQIVVRFHGERYPLVPNVNEANRARNRRVQIHLERGVPPTAVVPTEKAPAGKAAATS